MKINLKENKGVSNSVVVMLVVFIAILVCLLFYFIKNPIVKVVEKEEAVTPPPATTQVAEVNTTNNEKTKEMTADEKYKIFAENLKKEVSKYGDKANTKSVFCRGDNTDGSWYTIKLNSNGNLSLHFGDENLNKKYGTENLAKNVLAAYIIDIGQDDWHCIYFIKEDGTVGSAYVDSVVYNKLGVTNDKESIKIKEKIDGLKNIVSILDGGVGLKTSGNKTPLFIDIDGNVYTEN